MHRVIPSERTALTTSCQAKLHNNTQTAEFDSTLKIKEVTPTQVQTAPTGPCPKTAAIAEETGATQKSPSLPSAAALSAADPDAPLLHNATATCLPHPSQPRKGPSQGTWGCRT